MDSLLLEKTDQAIEILRAEEIDLWLTFVRETIACPDPVLPLIYGHELTWQSGIFLHSSGEKLAVVGRFEVEAAKNLGVYEVLGYDHAFSQPLLEVLQRLNPNKIAINYSTDDVMADGLSHGLYKLLLGYLNGTQFRERLISAEPLIAALRSQKTNAEVTRIKTAIRTTEDIYRSTFENIRPGMREIDLAAVMHSELKARQLEPAWERSACPTINAGPNSPIGHVGPTDIQVEPGQIVHFDFGVQQNQYCSDIQRVVYIQKPGERSAPDDVERGFKTVVRAVEAAVAALKPGTTGFEVDQIAREVITGAGYPDYKYATGHQLGRFAHDGGGILGPLWERYGETPLQEIKKNQVYTVEPGLFLPGYGYLGLEEDVLVLENETVYLTTPQKELYLIPASS